MDVQTTTETTNKNDFLFNCGLVSVNDQNLPNDTRLNTSNSISRDIFMSPDKNKRRSYRNRRHPLTMAKCLEMEFASPFGMVLLKKGKQEMSSEYVMERLERTEKYCSAPVIDKNNKPKWLKNSVSTFNSRSSSNSLNCPYVSYSGTLYNKSRSCMFRNYKFPRRQFMSRSRDFNFEFINRPLLNSVKPCKVLLKKLSEHEVVDLIELERLRAEQHRKIETEMERKRMEKIIDIIDLCSDGENDDNNLENDTPMLDLPEPPPNRLDGTFLTIPMETDSDFPAIRRNIFADLNNKDVQKMSALSGAISPKPQQQSTTTSVLRQSTVLFSNTRTSFHQNHDTSVFTVKNSWFQSVNRKTITN